MFSDWKLMNIHVEALFTHDAHQRLHAINEPDGAPAPRFFLGRTSEGNLWRFRADVPAALIQQLEGWCTDEPLPTELHTPPQYVEAYRQLLQAQAAIQRLWLGPAYQFPDELPPSPQVVRITRENAEVLRAGFADLIPELDVRQPCLAVVQAGRAISLCYSVRITAQAHEAGVETLVAFRGRGYATQVVAGWAVAVREVGCLPLYSTSWENRASQGVAKKLGLVVYGVDFHVT